MKRKQGSRRWKSFEGKLPRRALGLILDWAELHQQELLDNWIREQEHDTLSPIAPLV
jgi:hypothetical protein